MRKTKRIGWMWLLILIFSPFSQASTDLTAVEPKISGKIVDGYRVLTIGKTDQPVEFRVYRGDYIKFDFDDSVGDPTLTIPALSVSEILPDETDQAPYFKMKQTGRLKFSLGETMGSILVIDYRQEHYRELTADQAATFIESLQPLILDVRTPNEFKSGHLKNARLIPVQELTKRLHEIASFKNREIIVYCATGNRSTVASKILNDNGFNRISNLRYGIYQWAKNRFPIVR